MAKRDPTTDPALEELRAFGLTYPGAHTKSPWPGHLDLAVNDKTFAYLSVAGEPFTISCKLPHSVSEALSLPFVTATAYGLGKSGWVTAQLPAGPVPVEMFKAWIDESYRAQVPKRLSARLPEIGADGVSGAETPRPLRRPPAPTRAPRSSAKKRPVKQSSSKERSAQKRAEKPSAARRKRAKKRPAAARRAAS